MNMTKNYVVWYTCNTFSAVLFMGGQSDTQHAQGIPEYIRTYRNITINPAQQSLDPVYIIYILVYELFAPITTSLL